MVGPARPPGHPGLRGRGPACCSVRMRPLRAVLATLVACVTGAVFVLVLFGKTWRAVIWLGLLVVIAALGALCPWCLWGVVALFVAMLGDVFQVALRDENEVHLRWLAPWLLLGATVVIALGLRTYVLEAFRAPSSSMAPTLVIGDHFFIDKLTPRWRGYERGDVIAFQYPCDPRKDYVKRVVALGGDTVEVRCDVVYVDGKAVPDQLVARGAQCSYAERDEIRGWFSSPCSRYRETLGGHAFEILDEPERPELAARSEPSMRDFPRRGAPAPSCEGADPEGLAPAPVVAPQGTLVATAAADAAGACAPQLHYVVPAGTLFVLGDNRANSNDSRYWGVVRLSMVKGRVTAVWMGGHGAHARIVH